MRIGIDCRLWSESGVGRYTRNLVRELQILDKENEYILFALSMDKKNVQSKISSLDGSKFQICEANVRWHTIKEQLLFPSIIAREDLDLVHFPYFSVPIFYTGKFVVTIHDLILHHYPTGKASTLPDPIYRLKLLGYKFVIREAARKAKKIIAVSKATKKEVIDHLDVDAKKVEVIYEGADELNSKFKIQNSKLNKEKYFLYVGNAYPHKNLERMIKAFSAIIRQPTDQPSAISLVLVGKEDYFYRRLKRKVKHMGLENSVGFVGQVSDEELANLYQQALALIAPSLMEGFGLTTLEAMRNRCLVIASDIPVHHEICGDAAVYFDPKNSEGLTEKMQQVYLNDIYHLSEYIKKGTKRTEEFSWKKMAEQTLRLYESIK